MTMRRSYDDDYGRGRDDDRGRSRRGFDARDERRSETSSRGERSSRSSRDWDERDDDDDRRSSGRGRGWFGDYEGHSEAAERGWESRGGGRDYDDGERYSSRDGNGRGRSSRGFGSMDREEQREIARMGGEASHGGRRWEEEDYDRGRSSRYEDEDRGRNSGRRGFAAMDPEEQREIARMGGRASHGGRRWEDNDDRYENSRSSRNENEDGRSRSSRSSERGFAAMDPEEQREIASMGGRAAHRSGRAHEWDSREARRAAQSRWED
jgi:general stress protein YciG